MCSSCSKTGVVICTLRGCDIDICSLLPDSGPCRAAFPAYHFNQTSGRCEEFVYGGCGGNRNKFATRRECKGRCGSKSELTVFDNDGDGGDGDNNSGDIGDSVMKATSMI